MPARQAPERVADVSLRKDKMRVFWYVPALLMLLLTFSACGVDSSDSSDNTAPAEINTAAQLANPSVQAASTDASQPSCDITPSKTEGPFYFDAGHVRRDITEGKPGTPLLVAFRLVEAGSCVPISNAFVDIWHTDAAGLYSGYRGQGDDDIDTSGQTFLRGKQITDADGLAEFETIYPGSYPGRTIHIHFKAYTDERSLLTSQMHFPDDVTDIVFQSEPYVELGPRGTTNENDRVLNGDSSDQALLGQVTEDEDGYKVSLTVSVVR